MSSWSWRREWGVPTHVRAGVLDGLDLSPVLPRGRDGERSCGATLHAAEGGRGRGQPPASVRGPGSHSLDGPWLLGFY
jgi:hypothetical protein